MSDTTHPTFRADGFQNLLTKIGTLVDPSSWTRFRLDGLTDRECEVLARGNYLAGKVCELLPKAAYREGFDITIPDAEEAGEVMSALEDLGIREVLTDAAIKERMKGGAAIYPVLNDGADLATPLQADGRIDEIVGFVVLEARELWPDTWYRDMNAGRKFRRPETYFLRPAVGGTYLSNQWGQRIHESRLVIFPGLIVADDQVSENYGWGDSRLIRAHRVLEQFGLSWEGLSTLMQRIEQGVLSIDGFAEALANDQEGTLSKALTNIDRLRSLLKMLVIDKSSTYQRLGVPLTGVPDVLELLMLVVCAVVEAPATQVFGMAPKGLNATGESDLVQWENQVAGEQTSNYGPRVKQLVEMYMRSNAGITGGAVPEKWHIQWRPLRQQDEGEIAKRNYAQAQADEIYLDKGVVTPEIVRRNRFAGETYSLETRVTEEDEADLDMAEAAVAAMPTPTDETVPGAAPSPMEEPPVDVPPEPRADHLEKIGSRWVVWNQRRTKKLGTFRTRAKAVALLRSAEYYGGRDQRSDATPAFQIGDRVTSLVDHAPGMRGMAGTVTTAREGTPPYYGVTFDDESKEHRWLAEDEIAGTSAA